MDTSINGEPLGEWEPEDTAPRDGTVVLVKRAGAVRACTGYINENGDWSFHEDWPRHVGRVTHWRRLPHLVDLPEAADEVERLRQGLRAIRNHWNDFGPANGFEETLERACKPIQINSDEQSAPWTGLARAIEIVENHVCADFCACKYEILQELKSNE